MVKIRDTSLLVTRVRLPPAEASCRRAFLAMEGVTRVRPERVRGAEAVTRIAGSPLHFILPVVKDRRFIGTRRSEVRILPD